MNFRICIVGSIFGMSVSLLLKPDLLIRFLLCSTQAFYQFNAAPRKSCQRCCKQSLIITVVAESVSFKLVGLQ